MNESETGALVVKGFYGPMVQLRPYFAGLTVLFLFQLTMVVLSILGIATLSPVVFIFVIIVLAFELMIILFGCQTLIKTYTHLNVLWSGELDWDLYENGILAKVDSGEEDQKTVARFVPFRTISRAMLFPRGQRINEVFELHQDRMRLRDSDRPVNAGSLSREIASTISDRVWFVDADGKLLDLTMERKHFRKSAMGPFRKHLQEKVKVVE